MKEIDFILSGLEPYVARSQLKEAGTFIDESLGRLENLALVLNIRGLAAREQGDLKGARAAFTAAVALRPRDAALHYNLADVCWRLRDFVASARACRVALEIEPGAAESARLFGVLTKHLGGDPSTLYAFYDLAISPVTFDFVAFLALADVERRRRGADALRVIFVPGLEDGFRRFTERDLSYDRVRKEWRVHNIQVPACRLVPACSGSVVCTTRMEALAHEQAAGDMIFPPDYSVLRPKIGYEARRLLEAAKAGDDVRVLQPTPQALIHVGEWLQRRAEGRAAVSITLRQSDFQPVRNTDLSSWARFALWLEERNFLPVIVPDTEAHLSGTSAALGAGIEYPAAAVNIELRAALYKKCLTNLMVGTGPLTICISGADISYIAFILLHEGATASTAEWFVSQGMPPGTQPAYAGPLQRIAWDGQEFETIVGEFEAMLARMRALGVAPS